mmetsp:Transcript_99529/g.287291  ORF Transcript_99529/g.287291 Transcript_99529/m.287291 type:complete len:350 (+) Transcript_99529:300-1349(+)
MRIAALAAATRPRCGHRGLGKGPGPRGAHEHQPFGDAAGRDAPRRHGGAVPFPRRRGRRLRRDRRPPREGWGLRRSSGLLVVGHAGAALGRKVAASRGRARRRERGAEVPLRAGRRGAALREARCEPRPPAGQVAGEALRGQSRGLRCRGRRDTGLRHRRRQPQQDSGRLGGGHQRRAEQAAARCGARSPMVLRPLPPAGGRRPVRRLLRLRRRGEGRGRPHLAPPLLPVAEGGRHRRRQGRRRGGRRSPHHVGLGEKERACQRPRRTALEGGLGARRRDVEARRPHRSRHARVKGHHLEAKPGDEATADQRRHGPLHVVVRRPASAPRRGLLHGVQLRRMRQECLRGL